jgi:hypothetical protein
MRRALAINVMTEPRETCAPLDLGVVAGTLASSRVRATPVFWIYFNCCSGHVGPFVYPSRAPEAALRRCLAPRRSLERVNVSRRARAWTKLDASGLREPMKRTFIQQ